MLDIFQPVSPGDVVETGIVTEYLGNEKYRVLVRGKEKIVPSTVKGPVVIGNCVVINKTRNGRFIIGATGQFKTQKIKEVVIDA